MSSTVGRLHYMLASTLLFAAGVALYVRSRRVPDPNAAEPPELPQDSAESEKK